MRYLPFSSWPEVPKCLKYQNVPKLRSFWAIWKPWEMFLSWDMRVYFIPVPNDHTVFADFLQLITVLLLLITDFLPVITPFLLVFKGSARNFWAPTLFYCPISEHHLPRPASNHWFPATYNWFPATIRWFPATIRWFPVTYNSFTASNHWFPSCYHSFPAGYHRIGLQLLGSWRRTGRPPSKWWFLIRKSRKIPY